MTEFYFVRHGQTMNNVLGRYSGGVTDSPLTEVGVQHAEEAGQFLKDVHFDNVYVSPQPRAQKTAQLVLAPNDFEASRMTTVNDLHEINQGDWDGDIRAYHIHEPQAINYYHHPEKYDAANQNGESYPDMIKRGRAVIDKIYQANPKGRVLVVSHGTFLLVLLKTLQGVPLKDVRNGKLLDNSSISIFTTDDGKHFTCTDWNDTSFMNK
ncbi:phosphoglycerate mutase [Lactobacillus selangorensis]|uniref:Phosphoglycerate mutase n=1 Tax=Lactobacillus selangorensis TaxID=81857 RepID=A0A0R2FT86_9LACO|nr:histidine phosphatase family protein [Lactobacillus selangorensis]KRN28364.1 phosphoglycerate mutase [Lactobacillus selangorensis]KRN31865.1 phosphoglycerate mutase [Lactobacillus selangorensis]